MKRIEDIAVQFDVEAQRVWTTPDIEGKKEILHRMIDAFKFPKKAEQFRQKVDKMTSGVALDRLAADVMQVGHGNKVIK